ncbi:hypothetical protein GmHk_06G016972 [Glycine max]|nr:hypothetical protein GmHk_06G016972 [Glycine max]
MKRLTTLCKLKPGCTLSQTSKDKRILQDQSELLSSLSILCCAKPRQLLSFLSKTFVPLPFLCFIVTVLKCYCIAFLASSYFAHIQSLTPLWHHHEDGRDISILGFPALITALCKARGVQSNSRSLESLSPAINLAYIKKNYWNLDDPTLTFRGPRKARGKRFEAPSTSAPSEAPTPSSSPVPPSSSTQILVIPLAPLQMPLPAPISAGPSDFLFTLQMLHSMMQRDQPSSSGEGGASAAQEPDTEEPPATAATEDEDELTPLEPSYFDAGTHTVQEEETIPDQTPHPSPSPAHIPKDVAPVAEPKQLIQDSSAAPTLDLNEDQLQEEQDI